MKTIRVKFGGVTLSAFSKTNTSASAWCFIIDIIRTGATSQIAIISRSTELSATPADEKLADYTTAAETLSGSVTLKVTGEATDNDDIVCNGLIIDLFKAGIN